MKGLKLGSLAMSVIFLFKQINSDSTARSVTTLHFVRDAIKRIQNMHTSLRKLRFPKSTLLLQTQRSLSLKVSCFVVTVRNH